MWWSCLGYASRMKTVIRFSNRLMVVPACGSPMGVHVRTECYRMVHALGMLSG